MSLSIKGIFSTLNIKDTWDSNTLPSAIHDAEYCISFIVMLSVVMLSVVMLNVVMLGVVVPFTR
jgi:hypothetical protein